MLKRSHQRSNAQPGQPSTVLSFHFKGLAPGGATLPLVFSGRILCPSQPDHVGSLCYSGRAPLRSQPPQRSHVFLTTRVVPTT